VGWVVARWQIRWEKKDGLKKKKKPYRVQGEGWSVEAINIGLIYGRERGTNLMESIYTRLSTLGGGKKKKKEEPRALPLQKTKKCKKKPGGAQKESKLNMQSKMATGASGGNKFGKKKMPERGFLGKGVLLKPGCS